MTTEHILPGLTTKNLLAVLTLFGVLKVIERSNPEWNPCTYWKDNKAYLCISKEKITKEQIVDSVISGLISWGKGMKFEEENLKLSADDFRKLEEHIDPEVIVALGSDGCKKRKEEFLEDTPLCMMFGAGHQLFLDRLKRATSIENESKVKEEIHDVLFKTWNDKISKQNINFRWSHEEYRPHAYRDKNPSGDGTKTMDGANRLSAIGFTAYSCIPTNHGLETMCHVKKSKGGEYLIWPIWEKKLSIDAIMILMRDPIFKKIIEGEEDKEALQRLQENKITHIMKAKLFWDGQYKNSHMAQRIN